MPTLLQHIDIIHSLSNDKAVKSYDFRCSYYNPEGEFLWNKPEEEIHSAFQKSRLPERIIQMAFYKK